MGMGGGTFPKYRGRLSYHIALRPLILGMYLPWGCCTLLHKHKLLKLIFDLEEKNELEKHTI
jgi:hypothetical protein